MKHDFKKTGDVLNEILRSNSLFKVYYPNTELVYSFVQEKLSLGA